MAQLKSQGQFEIETLGPEDSTKLRFLYTRPILLNLVQEEDLIEFDKELDEFVIGLKQKLLEDFGPKKYRVFGVLADDIRSCYLIRLDSVRELRMVTCLACETDKMAHMRYTGPCGSSMMQTFEYLCCLEGM